MPDASLSPVARVAGVVLLRADGAALLQLRDDRAGLRLAGNWVFPGGHSDPGETADACARREFLEETAYACGALELLVDFLDDTEFPPQQLTFFWARYDGLQTPRCLEGQALEFVARANSAARRAPCYLLRVWDLALAAAALRAPFIL